MFQCCMKEARDQPYLTKKRANLLVEPDNDGATTDATTVDNSTVPAVTHKIGIKLKEKLEGAKVPTSFSQETSTQETQSISNTIRTLNKQLQEATTYATNKVEQRMIARRNLENLVQEESNLKGLVETLKKDLEEAKWSTEILENKFQQAKERFEMLKKDLGEAAERKQILGSEFKQAEQKFKELQNQVGAIEKRSGTLVDKIQEAKNELQEADTEAEKASATLTTLSTQLGNI